jgi:hypothetical protein
MKKRAAMVIAAGLVGALLVGSVAFTMGVAGPQTRASSSALSTPHVRTIHRTVTVHRHAKGPTAPVIRTISAPSSPTVARSAWRESDDRYEGESNGGFGGEGESHGGYEDD